MIPTDTTEKEEEKLKKLWESLCRQKIQDAYSAYMKLLEKM